MSKIGSAIEAGVFLESLVVANPLPYRERERFALQTVSALLEQIGNPHKHLKVIHITGSKGKGSTALLVEALLCAAGFKVGTFTSPHLQRWSERYRINGREISAEQFADLMEQMREPVETVRSSGAETSTLFFDTATAAALLLFQQQQVDYAVVEVGLGGRLDATNIVEPAITCITSIELEHTDKLGTTLAAIAYEKAGIIKPSVPVVVGNVPPEAGAVIEQRARECNAPVIKFSQGFRLESVSSDIAQSSGRLISNDLDIVLKLPLLGEPAVYNAALAAVCVQQLNVLSPAQLQSTIQKGFQNVVLPARCEILSRSPWIIVDAAHTTQSATVLRQLLDKLPVPHIHWILSLTIRKQPHGLCQALLRPGDRVTVTKADPGRSQEPEEFAAFIKKHYPDVAVNIIADPASALRQARAQLTEDSLLCITGSVYLAGLGRGLFAVSPSLQNRQIQ